MPALMREGRVTPAQRDRARAVLSAVGLADAMNKRPGELSGGMQQRVAIARALVLEPPLVVADEPTGNLDNASSDEVFALMRRMHAELNISFLMVTHDPQLAARAQAMLAHPPMPAATMPYTLQAMQQATLDLYLELIER